MEMILFVAGILRIHGATGGWTVWALSGDQRIPHVFKAQRGSIELSYPHMGMDGYLVVRHIENTGVSTFLLLMFVPFFILHNYYGRSLRIRIMWFDNISVIFLLGCLESSG
jgi:hypothetical protein